jgi:hypothetical protein
MATAGKRPLVVQSPDQRFAQGLESGQGCRRLKTGNPVQMDNIGLLDERVAG